MGNWEWKENGLYDGDVEILWVTQDNTGAFYLGIMADYEDLLPAARDMLDCLKDARRAIASLEPEALGTSTQGHLAWFNRDELLRNIDDTITQAGGS